MRQKGFAPILILLIVVLGVVLFLAQKKSDPQDNPEPIASDMQRAEDERDCIPNETDVTTTKSFFEKKWFVSFAASGTWGELKPDGTITEGWGLDYGGPNDTRANSGIGSWSYNNGVVTLSGLSGNQDLKESFSNFRYFSFKDTIFAVPKEYSGVIFGTDKQSIEDFFDTYISPMWRNNTGCKL